MAKFKLENQKETVLSRFDSGESCTDIANSLGVYLQTVTNLIKHYRPTVSLVPNKGNIHYFENIDSYAKAYIVGFIAADGAVVKTKTSTSLTITLKYEDKAVLEFIKSEIGNSHKLQEIIRPSSFDKSKIIHHIRYCISDKIIIRDLQKLGVTYNKSLTMENIIENIPHKYRDAFIIGYFDGDGSVSIRKGLHRNSKGKLVPDHSLYINIRGTKSFLEGICNHLNIDTCHVRQFDSIPSLNFASKKDVVRLYQCYNNLPFYYKRKHDKFLQRINHPSFDKYKQVQTISSFE